MKKSVAAVCALGLLMVTAVAAQQPPPAEKPARRGVLVPVSVTDASGKPISGLKAQDFLVKKGKTELPLIEAQEADGAVSAQGGKRPLFLVLDQTSVVAPQLGSAKAMLLRFLADSLVSGEPIGLLSITRRGIAVGHQPGTPPPVVAAALQRLDAETRILDGKVPAALAQSVEEKDKPAVEAVLRNLKQFGEAEEPYSRSIDAAFTQLRGLQMLAGGLRRIPGRKQLAFVTNGLPLTLMGSEGRLYFQGQREHGQENLQLTVEFEKAIELLNEARVTLYPLLIDARGSNVDPMVPTFARATAGKYITFQSEVGQAVKEVLADAGSYYSILCEVPPARGNSVEWTKLDVDVKIPGAKVRYPEGLFVMPVPKQ